MTEVNQPKQGFWGQHADADQAAHDARVLERAGVDPASVSPKPAAKPEKPLSEQFREQDTKQRQDADTAMRTRGLTESVKEITESEAFRDPRHPLHEEAQFLAGQQMLADSVAQNSDLQKEYSTFQPAGLSAEDRNELVGIAAEGGIPAAELTSIMLELGPLDNAVTQARETDTNAAWSSLKKLWPEDAEARVEAIRDWLADKPNIARLLDITNLGSSVAVIKALDSHVRRSGTLDQQISQVTNSPEYRRGDKDAVNRARALFLRNYGARTVEAA